MSKLQPTIHHFRTHNGDKVDLLPEDRNGRIVGIELKASDSVDASHFPGSTTVPFASNRLAFPTAEIWA